jgi:hypothetical protein
MSCEELQRFGPAAKAAASCHTPTNADHLIFGADIGGNLDLEYESGMIPGKRWSPPTDFRISLFDCGQLLASR